MQTNHTTHLPFLDSPRTRICTPPALQALSMVAIDGRPPPDLVHDLLDLRREHHHPHDSKWRLSVGQQARYFYLHLFNMSLSFVRLDYFAS